MMNIYPSCCRLAHPTPQSPSPCLSLEQKLQKLNVCFPNLSTAREGCDKAQANETWVKADQQPCRSPSFCLEWRCDAGRHAVTAAILLP